MEVERKGGREAESNVRKTQQSPSHTNNTHTDIPFPCEINCAAATSQQTAPCHLGCADGAFPCAAVSSNVLQCFAVCCSVLQWLCAMMHHPVCCSAMQRIAVCCSGCAQPCTTPCAAVRGSLSQWPRAIMRQPTPRSLSHPSATQRAHNHASACSLHCNKHPDSFPGTCPTPGTR